MTNRIGTRYSELPILMTLFVFPFMLLGSKQRAIALPTAAQGWSELTRQDVEAAYQITAENHPGMVDSKNLRFP